MREDIYGAIKNALDRGANLEQAIKSLINSGYSEFEVRQAAKSFTEGAISPTPLQIQPLTLSKAPPAPAPALPTEVQKPIEKQKIGAEVKKKLPIKIIVLVIILIILLSALIATFFFRSQIIDFLTGLF